MTWGYCYETGDAVWRKFQAHNNITPKTDT